VYHENPSVNWDKDYRKRFASMVPWESESEKEAEETLKGWGKKGGERKTLIVVLAALNGVKRGDDQKRERSNLGFVEGGEGRGRGAER
jgi:hypothetical protein